MNNIQGWLAAMIATYVWIAIVAASLPNQTVNFLNSVVKLAESIVHFFDIPTGKR